ncbi:hypothetical protein SH611_08555 [Geminicoccaceae bacterium 1502E]|uniref:Uncharacterized protein n=1 Tax=Marinimicrococcus flavescens TaxID=3031815 RepID=A0AAP3UZA0_9PROT|nr:hypothetical protein [Marinimicrococcus flavescens]MDX6749854.1 hypothetical protein [Geminicoccaceae bacterium 1502E]
MRDPAPEDHPSYEFDHTPEDLLPEAGTTMALCLALLTFLFIL